MINNDYFTKYISFQIGSLSRDLTKYFNSHLTKHNITIGQVLVLLYLNEHGASPIKNIANGLEIESPAVSRIVDRMLKDDIVHRQENKSDRRCMEITLTEKGTTLALETAVVPQTYNQLLIDKLGQEKYDMFVEIMEEIQETVK